METPFRLLLLALSLLTCQPAFALGFGNAAGQAIVGQALSVRIPLTGEDVAKARPDCIRLLPDSSDIADPAIRSATLTLAGNQLLIETRQSISQPVVGFRLVMDCTGPVSRDYQLLSLLPATPATATAAAPITATASPATKTAMTDFTLTKASTLRLISRQRYPSSSRQRVIFIQRVAAANPELFASLAASYDQPLAAGQQLRLPADLPPPETAKAPAPPPAGAGGKGKLVIGATASFDSTIDELQSDITRLTDVMNEQILIQTSMVTKLRQLEVEVSNAKQAATLQQAAAQKMEREIQDLREQQRRNSHVQMALAILLAGLAVFNALRWHQRRAPF